MLALNARDTTLAILAPLIVWGSHFLICYVLVAVVCARGWQAAEVAGIGAAHLALGAVTAAALALLGWSVASHVGYWRRHADAEGEAVERARFVARLGAMVAGVSFIGTAWVALPILILPVCSWRGATLG